MIFGVCSFDPILKNDKLPFPFYNNSCDFRTFETEKDKFSARCLINNSFPFLIRDYYYHNQEADCLVLFYGSIYNRSELSSKYFKDQLFPDPELIFRLFSAKGRFFAEELNGDFSFVLFQLRENILWLYRDHLGIKPLAFFKKGNQIWFSTDHISLCKFFHEKHEKINFNPLLSFRRIGNTIETYNPKVKKVLPGHFYCFTEENITLGKYWKPERIKENDKISFSEAVEKIKCLLKDSVEIRSDSRFTAGTHISGGLDSSVVAALARKNFLNQKEFTGFSYAPEKVQFSDIKQDERLLVLETCKINDIKPVFSNMSLSFLKESTNNFLFNLGWVWEDEVRNKAKKPGVNLIFSGWGGDEFISSSQKGYDIELFLKLKWWTFVKRNSGKLPRSLFAALYNKVFLPFFGKIRIQLKKSYNEELVYFKREYSRFDKQSFKNYFKFRSKKDVLTGLINNFHLAERTEMWSVHGFIKGIEYRYPLLDKRIIELILSIPAEHFGNSNSSRLLFREASLNVVPDSVRLNDTKLDEVVFKYFKEITSMYCDEILEELAEIKKNSDLDIINFELLEKHIKKYFKEPNNKKLHLFPGNVVFIKMLHEFTKAYRSSPETDKD